MVQKPIKLGFVGSYEESPISGPSVHIKNLLYRNSIKHNENGYLSGQSSECFAKGMFRVLQDDSLRGKISRNAHVSVKKYSVSKITNHVERVYNILLLEVD